MLLWLLPLGERKSSLEEVLRRRQMVSELSFSASYDNDCTDESAEGNKQAEILFHYNEAGQAHFCSVTSERAVLSIQPA
jgi:hypothetical protein